MKKNRIYQYAIQFHIYLKKIFIQMLKCSHHKSIPIKIIRVIIYVSHLNNYVALFGGVLQFFLFIVTLKAPK